MEKDKIEEVIQETPEGSEQPDEQDKSENKLQETIQKIKASAHEEDLRPASQLNLRTILGGDLLTTEMVRSQIC